MKSPLEKCPEKVAQIKYQNRHSKDKLYLVSNRQQYQFLLVLRLFADALCGLL